jgi:hypothetical protein
LSLTKVADRAVDVKMYSLPIQDEPEGSIMLGCEHPHGRCRKVEFGGDWPVCNGQRGNPV